MFYCFVAPPVFYIIVYVCKLIALYIRRYTIIIFPLSDAYCSICISPMTYLHHILNICKVDLFDRINLLSTDLKNLRNTIKYVVPKTNQYFIDLPMYDNIGD